MRPPRRSARALEPRTHDLCPNSSLPVFVAHTSLGCRLGDMFPTLRSRFVLRFVASSRSMHLSHVSCLSPARGARYRTAHEGRKFLPDDDDEDAPNHKEDSDEGDGEDDDGEEGEDESEDDEEGEEDGSEEEDSDDDEDDNEKEDEEDDDDDNEDEEEGEKIAYWPDSEDGDDNETVDEESGDGEDVEVVDLTSAHRKQPPRSPPWIALRPLACTVATFRAGYPSERLRFPNASQNQRAPRRPEAPARTTARRGGDRPRTGRSALTSTAELPRETGLSDGGGAGFSRGRGASGRCRYF